MPVNSPYSNLACLSLTMKDQVRGMVVVGGYSKMAEQSIRELQELHPEIQVKLFDYKLEGL